MATVSPFRMRRTASSAETTLLRPEIRKDGSRGWTVLSMMSTRSHVSGCRMDCDRRQYREVLHTGKEEHITTRLPVRETRHRKQMMAARR